MSAQSIIARPLARTIARAVSALAVTGAVAAAPLFVQVSSAAAEDRPPVVVRSVPMYGSMPNPTAAEIKKRIDAGWATGAFLYYSPGTTFGWSTQWDQLAATFPQGVDLFVSPKNFTTESLTTWAQKLSPAQRAKTVFAYWQEPEDNFTTPAAQADFRQRVTDAAAILHPFGIRNGIEMQSWTLNAGNTQAWAGNKNFKAFIPADKSAVDFVGISVYDYHQKFSGPTQLKPVVNLLAKNLPDAEWGPVAMGWSVPVGTPADSPIRVERAAAAQDALNYAMNNGADAVGWWDFADFGNDNNDYTVSTDPRLQTMLTGF
jgi:hypothetical protein